MKIYLMSAVCSILFLGQLMAGESRPDSAFRDLEIARVFNRIYAVNEDLNKNIKMGRSQLDAYKAHAKEILNIKKALIKLVEIEDLVDELKKRLDYLNSTGSVGHSKHPYYLWNKQMYDFLIMMREVEGEIKKK